MDRSLIYDVGMATGDDTARYLAEGFRVLAIEASTNLVEQAKRRFRLDLAEGRLTILERAIAEREGEVPFFLIDGKPEWNTVDAHRAGRSGLPVRSIQVAAVRFRSVLAEYGVPFYLKIDIEGSDRLCVADLAKPDLPAYVSFELSSDARELTDRLCSLGYGRFKCISQENFLPMEINPGSELQDELSRAKRIQQITALAYRARDRLDEGSKHGVSTRQRPMRSVGGSSFPLGSSGPFGESTLGRWQSRSALLKTLDHFETRYEAGDVSPFWTGAEASGSSPWADIHARLADD